MNNKTINILRGNLAKGYVSVKRNGSEGDARQFVHNIRVMRDVVAGRDRTLSYGPWGRGNAVSRRLGYTVESFSCACAWSPCQHEPIYERGGYHYEAPYDVIDWRYLAQLKPATRIRVLERSGDDVV